MKRLLVLRVGRLGPGLDTRIHTPNSLGNRMRETNKKASRTMRDKAEDGIPRSQQVFFLCSHAKSNQDIRWGQGWKGNICRVTLWQNCSQIAALVREGNFEGNKNPRRKMRKRRKRKKESRRSGSQVPTSNSIPPVVSPSKPGGSEDAAKYRAKRQTDEAKANNNLKKKMEKRRKKGKKEVRLKRVAFTQSAVCEKRQVMRTTTC
ncbi:hypothetical protein J3F83DRAFT_363493 [Trichoderma novae-zelandiae]